MPKGCFNHQIRGYLQHFARSRILTPFLGVSIRICTNILWVMVKLARRRCICFFLHRNPGVPRGPRGSKYHPQGPLKVGQKSKKKRNAISGDFGHGPQNMCATIQRLIPKNGARTRCGIFGGSPVNQPARRTQHPRGAKKYICRQPPARCCAVHCGETAVRSPDSMVNSPVQARARCTCIATKPLQISPCLPPKHVRERSQPYFRKTTPHSPCKLSNYCTKAESPVEVAPVGASPSPTAVTHGMPMKCLTHTQKDNLSGRGEQWATLSVGIRRRKMENPACKNSWRHSTFRCARGFGTVIIALLRGHWRRRWSGRCWGGC